MKSRTSTHCHSWHLLSAYLMEIHGMFLPSILRIVLPFCRVACDRGISWRKIQIRGLLYATWSILDFGEFCFPKMVILMSHKLCCPCAYRAIVGYQSEQTLAARHLQQLTTLHHHKAGHGGWRMNRDQKTIGCFERLAVMDGIVVNRANLSWTLLALMPVQRAWRDGKAWNGSCWDIRVANPGYIDISSKLNWSANGNKDSEIECWLAIYPST